jgi:hypothetical protein
MTDISSRIAICDQEAFYPFRALVQGQLRGIQDLAEAERFVRGVLLHDELVMEYEPWPAPDEEQEWTDEEIAAGARNVITAVGPVLNGYEEIVSRQYGPQKPFQDSLSPRLTQLAYDFSGAKPGDPYHNAHLDYIGRLVSTVRHGGSLICAGAVGTKVVETSSKYPEQLFSSLDEGWQGYARSAHAGDIGLVLPPMIAIVFSRARNREAVLPVLRDLKKEWAVPRRKVWNLIDELKNAATLQQANEIKQQLKEASSYLLPQSGAESFQPVRVFWDLVVESGKGAIEAGTSGGDPGVGAIVGGAMGAIDLAAKKIPSFAGVLFGRAERVNDFETPLTRI